MTRLLLILFGGDALIQRCRAIFGLGVLTLLVALAVLGDLVDGVADITTLLLGLILLALALFELMVGATHTGVRRQLELLRGLVMLTGASLVLDFPWDNAITSGAIFGVAFLLNGLFRLVACWLVRHPRWRLSALLGGGYVIAALLLLTSWPLPDDRNVSFCLGVALLAAGAMLMRGALQLRRLPPGTRVGQLGLLQSSPMAEPPSALADAVLPAGPRAPLTVHVWTAATATDDRIRLPVIERYVVALSRKGHAYSGHAALECRPGCVYISHHPRGRLRIDASNALQQVRATSENNRPGRWGDSYGEEAAAGRPSTLKVRFHRYNARHLQSFWQQYRQDDTYNFTHRNCSSAVARALDAALEGSFADKPFWPTLLRLLFTIDLWHAGRVRVRADALAWTPGFVQDYASALRRITYPRDQRRLRRRRRSARGRKADAAVGNLA